MKDIHDYIFYSEEMTFPPERPIPWVAKLNGISGFKCSYSLHWNMPFDERMQPAVPEGQRIVGHPPHKHKENEILFLFGSDPDDPWDLGATVEMCIGPDMERFVIERSCCLSIPADTPHGFYHISRCTRPWMFVEVHEGSEKTEKFLWDYLTPEEIASIPENMMKMWVDTGYDD